MDFKLKASKTTKWFRVTDWNNNANVHQPELSVVDSDGDANAVVFDVIPSDSSSHQRGYVKVEVARNESKGGKDQPSANWGVYRDDMQPEKGRTYSIGDEHLPAS